MHYATIDITTCANHTHPCGYVVNFLQYILDGVGSVGGAGLRRVKAFQKQVLKYLSAVVEELSSLVSNCEREQNYLRREWVEQERQQVETWCMRHGRRNNNRFKTWIHKATNQPTSYHLGNSYKCCS